MAGEEIKSENEGGRIVKEKRGGLVRAGLR